MSEATMQQLTALGPELYLTAGIFFAIIAGLFGGAINMTHFIATGTDDDSIDVDTGVVQVDERRHDADVADRELVAHQEVAGDLLLQVVEQLGQVVLDGILHHVLVGGVAEEPRADDALEEDLGAEHGHQTAVAAPTDVGSHLPPRFSVSDLYSATRSMIWSCGANWSSIRLKPRSATFLIEPSLPAPIHKAGPGF